jgi:hypothetical protein
MLGKTSQTRRGKSQTKGETLGILSSLKERWEFIGEKSGEIIADLLGENLEVTDAETTWEVNLALMKFKRTVRQKKKEE